jgi:hypothetical protein
MDVIVHHAAVAGVGSRSSEQPRCPTIHLAALLCALVLFYLLENDAELRCGGKPLPDIVVSDSEWLIRVKTQQCSVGSKLPHVSWIFPLHFLELDTPCSFDTEGAFTAPPVFCGGLD